MKMNLVVGLCSIWRQNLASRQIITYKSKTDIVQGLEAGAGDYLTKPYDDEESKARLRAGERIAIQATHDPMTARWNRGVIEELLARELYRREAV